MAKNKTVNLTIPEMKLELVPVPVPSLTKREMRR